MPGLSQLKKFNSDILALGDEVQLRASRGEKPVKIEIPQDVQDVDDSEDFVLGMPEIEAEIPEEEVDDDLSDLAGITNPGSESSDAAEESPAPSFETPDMSSLLNPIEDGDFAGDDMPDLSMFADEPVEEEQEIIEEEPEEVSIADMGLDALLSGGGFDQPEDSSEEEIPQDAEPEAEIEPVGIYDDLNDFDDLEEIEDVEEAPEIESEPEPVPPVDSDLEALGDFDSPAEGNQLETEDFDLPIDDLQVPESDFGTGEVENDSDIEDLGEVEELEDIEPIDSIEDKADSDGSSSDDFNIEDLDIPVEDFSAEESSEVSDGDLESPVEEELPEIDDSSEELPIEDLPDFDLPDADLPDADLPDADLPDADLSDTDLPADNNEETASGVSVDDFALPEDNITDNSVPEFSDLDIDNIDGDNFDLPDFNLDDNSIGEGNPVDSSDDNSDDNISDISDLDSADENSSDEDFSSAMPEGLFDANDVEFDAKDDIPDYEDFNLDDNLEDSDNKGEDNLDSSLEPAEVFDTSEMEGFDFEDIPDTDTQLNRVDDDSNFDVPRDDDFGSEFEIPGFSDVETVKEQKSNVKLVSGKEKKQKTKKNGHGEQASADVEEELPPNTLSDAQYKIFRQNLSEYPLNVRLAFEDLMVQDEFTDDAEFEIIEKILNKAPARQVASTLEKMLDISIPVPRDFEHRSAEEYEAYKKSISYQLRNKIIPAILLGVVGILICIGLFNFSKNCIYKPLKANSLYKQGYVLLQQTEYPLSEIKFNEATKYRLSKKWFYNYARGYREHKQYQRAGQMYQNILYCFKHDKAAGLEYADMELNDLANYARAEEIVNREVLDYHINDKDGILMLGDVYLEWATEKDPSKFELAREQYATLLQLYGQTDLYLSRMMRYFIRTDNLREVLQLKQVFAPKEKSLCSDDWTELSGYLLDKYYGELAPSEEYLRYEIEGLRELLMRAVKSNPANPIALYNLARYFIYTNEYEFIESTLQDSIEKFNAAEKMKTRDIYKYIDAYRLLGEHYISTDNYLQAQEQFAEGISLYITERDNAGFKGTPEIGKLYEDMGDLKYTISGDYDDALLNYTQSVNLDNDSSKIRYRIGYIQYNKKNYGEALGSFMKAGDGNIKERNLLLAMANTLSLRGDDYAAEGYYDQLIENLDAELADRGLVLPQASIKDYDLVNTYLSAANNYGVTLYRLAKKTGDSSKNAQAIVQFSQSVRAWDALTRNPETMVRLEGSNLAEQNIKYITHPIPEFEPSIYTNISKTLLDNEKL